MANEVDIALNETGLTLYALVYSKSNPRQVVIQATGALENYLTANRGNYDIPMTETPAGSRHYYGDMPVAVRGTYSIHIYQQAGASPAESDTKKGADEIAWTGTAVEADVLAVDGSGQVSISSADKDDVVDRVWDEAIAGHLAAGTTGLKLNSAAAAGDPLASNVPGTYGSGTFGYLIGTNFDQKVSLAGTGLGDKVLTITQKDTANNPIAGVTIWLTSDSAGTNVVTGSLTTDALGVVTFRVNAAGTYYRWASLAGVNFTNPQTMTVTTSPTQSFSFSDGSVATGSGGITAVDKIIGYDHLSKGSTPFSFRRGSRVVIRRTCLYTNNDTGLDSTINISGGQATVIVWHLLPDVKKGSVALLTKTLAASDITLPNAGADGIYEFVIDDSDTVNVAIGTYWAELAIVSGGNRVKFQPYHVTIAAAANLGE